MAKRAATKLTRIRKAIQDKGADWEAVEYDSDELAMNALVESMGLARDESEIKLLAAKIAADEAFYESQGSLGVPASFDWRNNGGNWITGVKNQRNCGSCVAFATLAALEARVRIACQRQDLALDLSESHLFCCGSGSSCNNGWTFVPALEDCKLRGVGSEADFPYVPQKAACRKIPISVKVSDWKRHTTLQGRKQAIAVSGPVLGGMMIFQDFYHYRSGVYRHVYGSRVGAHAVCIVGYDQQGWIVKNSWGSNWGDQGFARIAYRDACGIDTEYPFYALHVECPDGRDERDEAHLRSCQARVPMLKLVLRSAKTRPNLRRHLRFHICGDGSRPTPPNHAAMRIVQRVRAALHICPQKVEDWFCRHLRSMV